MDTNFFKTDNRNLNRVSMEWLECFTKTALIFTLPNQIMWNQHCKCYYLLLQGHRKAFLHIRFDKIQRKPRRLWPILTSNNFHFNFILFTYPSGKTSDKYACCRGNSAKKRRFDWLKSSGIEFSVLLHTIFLINSFLNPL